MRQEPISAIGLHSAGDGRKSPAPLINNDEGAGLCGLIFDKAIRPSRPVRMMIRIQRGLAS
jgi:hypothetical protein